jgi:hypothetical protein
MSLTAFKNKSVIQYGSKRSGKQPGGIWLPQGPFGSATTSLENAIHNYGTVGFSINGGHRNVGYIGKTYKMSKSGTPYRGTEPMGCGGTYGKYPKSEPLLNAREVDTLGSQYIYIKPSVLSNYGMLEKKYRWAYTGQYPNNWVQPIYTGNQTDTASQMLYIQNLASKNTCKLKVNNVGDYEGNIKHTGPTLCTPGRSTALFKYNDMARNAPYTKVLYNPVSYAQYNLYLTRGCNNPVGKQKPFPYAVQTGTGIKTGGISITSVGNACNTSNNSLVPPAWYISEKATNTLQNISKKPQTIPFIE